MANISFDATTVQPDEGFTPIPAGTYLAAIVDSDVKQTKAGTGYYLQATWRVLDGQHKGRLIFDRINVRNANQVAEQIGQKQLSGLCHAVGVLKLQDTTQLHNKPAMIRVTIRKDDQFGDSNEVKGYDKASGAPAPQMHATTPQGWGAQQSAPAAAPASATPPWQAQPQQPPKPPPAQPQQQAAMPWQS